MRPVSFAPAVDLQRRLNPYREGVSTYTIGEVAHRTGFSASSLRYYEGIGLLAPASRSDAGYRLYDDHTLAQLAFIGRAKQLGCSLEEITDLMAIWDGARCAPVQRRFHELITQKSAPRSANGRADGIRRPARSGGGTAQRRGSRWPVW